MHLLVACGGILSGTQSVSYTHLDVYKRQSHNYPYGKKSERNSLNVSTKNHYYQ